MNRPMLFAVLLFQSTIVFCQSTATPPGSPQTAGKGSMEQLPFDFSNSRPGQTAARPTFNRFDCQGSDAAQNQANAPIDFEHLFNAPCSDLKTHVEFLARNGNSFSQSPLVVQPRSDFEPIPTQWPKARSERIPTQWPNLKLQPIDRGSPGLIPAHGSRK